LRDRLLNALHVAGDLCLAVDGHHLRTDFFRRFLEPVGVLLGKGDAQG
jgi:hypothetical protein